MSEAARHAMLQICSHTIHFTCQQWGVCHKSSAWRGMRSAEYHSMPLLVQAWCVWVTVVACFLLSAAACHGRQCKHGQLPQTAPNLPPHWQSPLAVTQFCTPLAVRPCKQRLQRDRNKLGSPPEVQHVKHALLPGGCWKGYGMA